MAPYFETARSFADVPITESGVDTWSFLEASDGLMNMFDLLGSGVFGFVQSDIRSNISGVRGRYECTAEVSTTLERLVNQEVSEGSRQATACLVRLIRGLAFTCKALQNMQSDRHSELHIAIRAVPRRADFYKQIAQGGSVEKLDEGLAKWLEGLDGIVHRMTVFLESGGFGKV